MLDRLQLVADRAGGWSRNARLLAEYQAVPPADDFHRARSGPQTATIAQYVRSVADATATDTYGGRYVFGDLAQQQLTLTTRVNVILTPRVSIQIYAQPLSRSATTTTSRSWRAPRTFDFLSLRIPDIGELLYDPVTRRLRRWIPMAAGAAPRFTFDNPDFNFKSLRFNAVFRWEPKPGSAFYAVWTRQQQDSRNPGSFALGRDAAALFARPATTSSW